jgi:thioredoxin 1
MEITQEELLEKINNGDKLVVDFYTDWCGPCRLMKPIFEKVSEQFRETESEVQLYTMNVENNVDMASKYGIRSVPTIKAFSNGVETYSRSGALMENQIKDVANNLING